MRHLIVNLEAPLMSFGGAAIDNYGVTRRFPAASMLTGLFANALGWRRVERERHQRLQERLALAARIEREPAGGLSIRDFQSAAINNRQRGWTTRGEPEGRLGGTFQNTLRYRDYYADARVVVALRLEPADESPTLDDLAAALDEPLRPLFIGRKPCLPSARLFGGFAEGDTALAALIAAPLGDEAAANGDALISLQWPDGQGAEGVGGLTESRFSMLTDERNWVSGLHGGGRWVHEGTLAASEFGRGECAGSSDGEE